MSQLSLVSPQASARVFFAFLICLMILSLVTPAPALAGTLIVDFEDAGLAAGSFDNGSGGGGGFTSGGTFFGNSFADDGGGFVAWNGFALSSVSNTTTRGFTNQYAAATGGGVGGSGTYAVAYPGAAMFIDLPVGASPQSIRVTNTTYARLDMLSGSGFSKQFGGSNGTDPDFFSVTFRGRDGLGGTGEAVGSPVEFLLADYRFADSASDFIVDTWQEVDLTPLGGAASIVMEWASSDVGDFGINTPTYAAIDDLTLLTTAVPEPSTSLLVLVAAAAMAGRLRIRQ